MPFSPRAGAQLNSPPAAVVSGRKLEGGVCHVKGRGQELKIPALGKCGRYGAAYHSIFRSGLAECF